MAKQKVYTERCQDGNCSGITGQPSLIPDGAVVCDFCLLQRYGPMHGDSNLCLDPLQMDTWYREDVVVKALRMAAGL